MTIDVLALSGSLRADSHNTRLLRAAAELLPGAAFTVRASLKDLPPFDEDDEAGPPHPAVARLRRDVRRAHAVVVATPEYNGSVPGQLKNALDWLSRPLATNPLRDKPVAVVGASVSPFGAAWAQADARRILGVLGARVLDRDLPIGNAHEAFDADGRLVDVRLQEALGDVLASLAGLSDAGRVAA